MIFSSFHLIIKRYHQPWHSSSLFLRSNLNRQQSFFSKKTEFPLHYSQTLENVKFYRKAKETVYSLVIVSGAVALGGLTYLILHELYSRETPKGIYNEASKLCLADQRVQEALGMPISVHTSPEQKLMTIKNVRAKSFDEKGHRSMTLTFYLTGRERSSVVGVKVQKNISNKFVYDYILVQLDRPWQGQNILQICRSPSTSISPDN